MSTTRTRRTAATIAAATGLALTLAACGGGGGGTADDNEAAPSHTPGPLEKLWVDAYGEYDEDVANTQQARMEQLVAECMAAEGWEYVPVDYSTMNDQISIAPEGDSDEPEWGTEEFAKLRGYGITTWDDPGTEAETPLPEPETTEWSDPNADYVESLSDSARDSYYEALNGPQPTEEEINSGSWEYDPMNAGCYGEASEKVYNAGGNLYEDEKYQALFEEMNLIYSSVENDPDVAAAKAAWSACMAEAGFPGLADAAAAQDSIYGELEPLWEMGEEPDPDTLAALREKEIAIATADFACEKKAKVNEASIKVQHQAEQTFIDAHRTELEDLMSALKEQQEAQG